MATRGRVIVLHFAGQMPLAGIAWQTLHYLAGLVRLGYETWYVEDHGVNPYDPRLNSVVADNAPNIDYLKRVMERFGFAGRWAYWDAIKDEYAGMERPTVERLFRDSDALLNLCGATRLRDHHMECPRRILVDTDPVYEQIKYAEGDAAAKAYLEAHTDFFTYGENVGGPGWIVPLCGIGWKPTRPPVVLDFWPEADSPGACFSTIATWENKGKSIDYRGERYLWSKHVNFLRFLDLPRRVPRCFEVALNSAPQEVQSLIRAKGWRLRDARDVSLELAEYADFIRRSRGEFTVAKDIYVRPCSGWFSDRSVCYLASGRPVVTMDTGFSRFYPAGEGLLPYRDENEAAAAIAAVEADYPRHARAARRLAAEHFAAGTVLKAMMAEAGL
jgi:glycosyltransferase involved in cell wall biosynthesis